MINDLRYALRALWRSPGFSAAVILTMALGIGATVSIFTVVNAVILKRLPYPNPDRIVSLSLSASGVDEGVAKDSWFLEWQRSAKTIEALAVSDGASEALTGAGEPRVIRGKAVTEQYFRVMGAPPLRGRVFAHDDFAGDNGPVVLGFALWRDAFGSDSGLVGRTISLSGHARQVIGVMPAGFSPDEAQFWEPTTVQPPEASAMGAFVHYYTVVARVRSGVGLAAARTELAALALRSQDAVPAVIRDTAAVVTLHTLHDRLYGPAREPVLLLSVAATLLLLIACANVANLSLARVAARRQEFVVRTALGAGRWRLARLSLVESLLLSFAGAGFGLLVPAWILPIFLRYRPASLVNVRSLAVDASALGFAAVAAILTTLLFGILPALAAAAPDPVRTLHSATDRIAGGVRQRQIRHALIIAQIAIALALVTGAGLLSRSLASVLAIDPGFHPGNTLLARISLLDTRYDSAATATHFFDALAARARGIPGVDVAAYSAGTYPLVEYNVSVRSASKDGAGTGYGVAVVSRDYPAAAGLVPVAGRMFDARDRTGTGNVIVLNASAAHMFFPNQSAVGQSIVAGRFPSKAQCDTARSGISRCTRAQTPATVIGVVRDVARGHLETASLPQVYELFDQAVPTFPSLLIVRGRTDATALTGAVKGAVHELDPQQPINSFRFLGTELEMATAPRRFSAALILVFAALAISLAAIGLYGLITYQVVQQTREFGIRLALGARGPQLLARVVRDAMLLALIGIACGAALSFALARLLRGFLFGVGIHDPVTFVAAPVVLALVAACASYLPARRAADVDPAIALRSE